MRGDSLWWPSPWAQEDEMNHRMFEELQVRERGAPKGSVVPGNQAAS
jgi:hypothetical protein